MSKAGRTLAAEMNAGSGFTVPNCTEPNQTSWGLQLSFLSFRTDQGFEWKEEKQECDQQN